jgi:hypothetical protein
MESKQMLLQVLPQAACARQTQAALQRSRYIQQDDIHSTYNNRRSYTAEFGVDLHHVVHTEQTGAASSAATACLPFLH